MQGKGAAGARIAIVDDRSAPRDFADGLARVARVLARKGAEIVEAAPGSLDATGAEALVAIAPFSAEVSDHFLHLASVADRPMLVGLLPPTVLAREARMAGLKTLDRAFALCDPKVAPLAETWPEAAEILGDRLLHTGFETLDRIGARSNRRRRGCIVFARTDDFSTGFLRAAMEARASTSLHQEPWTVLLDPMESDDPAATLQQLRAEADAIFQRDNGGSLIVEIVSPSLAAATLATARLVLSEASPLACAAIAAYGTPTAFIARPGRQDQKRLVDAFVRRALAIAIRRRSATQASYAALIARAAEAALDLPPIHRAEIGGAEGAASALLKDIAMRRAAGLTGNGAASQA